MLKNICRSIASAAFVLASMPAAAQGGVRVDIPLPGIEIHVGHSAPPRMRSETRPPRPGKEYVWAGGSWNWHGNAWDWAPGRWDRPNDHGAHWVQARYVQEGSSWRHEPSHWSNQHMVEGDDYKRWKSEDHSNKGHDKGHDNGRDKGHDNGKGH